LGAVCALKDLADFPHARTLPQTSRFTFEPTIPSPSDMQMYSGKQDLQLRT